MSGWHTDNRFPGVRYREHKTRKAGSGAVKSLDRYFNIRYQKKGVKVDEGLGWVSEGWTIETAFAKLLALKEAAKNKSGPTSLKEERQQNAKMQEEKLAEQRRLEEEALREEQGNITVERFFTDTYLPIAKTSRKSIKSRDFHDESHFRLWLDPVLGKKPLRQVRAADLEKVKQAMQAAGRSPRTIEYVFATFRQIWNAAMIAEIVDAASPTLKVKLPEVDNERCRFLTKSEAENLLEEIKSRDTTLHNMAILSLYCGMRADEIFRLTWRNVDLENGVIRIADPKNKKSRYAYITAPAKTMLTSLPKGDLGAIIFLAPKGNPYNEAPDTFNQSVDALGLNAGVTDRRERVVFHSLRHTYGAWLAGNNVSLYKISKLLGHKTLAMTARYAHLGDDSLKKAAKTLELVSNEIAMIEEMADR